MTDHEAYDEGYDAYWDGVECEDNPYDPEQEPEKRNSWEEGWREARNRLHVERLAADRSKRCFRGDIGDLPNGVFVRIDAWGEQAILVWGGKLLAWSPGGYRERRPRPKRKEVLVMTPPSTVETIQAGYVPMVHASVEV